MNAGMLEWPISFMPTFTCRGKLRVYENKMAKDQWPSIINLYKMKLLYTIYK